jgi:hypothetical protein
MNPQETKALFDVLNRIATALEGKDNDIAVDIVNRFAEVYRRHDDLIKNGWTLKFNPEIQGLDQLKDIQKTHAKIAGEILSIYQKK